MEEQRQSAQQEMVQWLSNEQELGHAPAEIICAGEFDLHDLHYYYFQYKDRPDSQWLLGVCGGYEPESCEHCGHVFSDMEPFVAETAQGQAIDMVECIRSYWMERAREEQVRQEQQGQEPQEQEGTFVGFVLLKDCIWDVEQFKADLQEEWNIAVVDPECGEDGLSLVWETDGMMAAVSLMPAPVPEGEAEQAAARNQFWPEAVARIEDHKAHLMVAILPHSCSPVDSGKLYVKVCAACLKQENALGMYTAGTVLEPGFFRQVAEDMHEEELPVLDWVYFGIYRGENGICGYTMGLTYFGKDDIEVIDSSHSPQEVHEFLINVTTFLLSEDVTLLDGETIGFTQEQRLPISRSAGIAIEGMSLKIGF